jgi:pre-rRNA-processing protein IPI1
VNACVRIIGDEDASVRKGLLSFLSWLLLHPQLPPEMLDPHTPHLLLFTTSAQTHIFPDVRVDAIKVLDLLLQVVPRTVVAGWDDGARNMTSTPDNTDRRKVAEIAAVRDSSSSSTSHGSRVLDGYLGILNGGSRFGEGGDSGAPQATSTASVVLSAAVSSPKSCN